MISYIKGITAYIGADRAVFETGGMGFNVFMPSSSLEKLSIGGEETIYTYMCVREDSITLYGFLREEDLEFYRLLLGVSGIGPKGALSILSAISPDALREAIFAGDDKAIASAPGIGKKTAQRIIIELKDKVRIEDVIGADVSQSAGGDESRGGNEAEAIEALCALGYPLAGARRAVRSANVAAGAKTEDILKEALKNLI